MPDHAPVPSVIRILTENHHFNVTQLRKAERVKDIFLWWIDSDAGLPLAGDGLKGIKKIGLLLLFSQHIMPLIR